MSDNDTYDYYYFADDNSFKKTTSYRSYAGSAYLQLPNTASEGVQTINLFGSAPVPGDVNGDGTVGIGDIVAITNVMAGLAGDGSPVATRADVNGDGTVGIGDIVAVTNIMAGKQD